MCKPQFPPNKHLVFVQYIQNIIRVYMTEYELLPNLESALKFSIF